jgi:hypothetical protein
MCALLSWTECQIAQCFMNQITQFLVQRILHAYSVYSAYHNISFLLEPSCSILGMRCLGKWFFFWRRTQTFHKVCTYVYNCNWIVPEIVVIILILMFTFYCLGNLFWSKLSAFVTYCCMPILCWILYDVVHYGVW